MSSVSFNCFATHLTTLLAIVSLRIVFGTTQLFVFKHPGQETKSLNTYTEVTFELAQEEIAAKAGYTIDHQDTTMEVAILNKDLVSIVHLSQLQECLSFSWVQ